MKMSCKYLFESNYFEFICTKNGFMSMGTRDPYRCEDCEDYCWGKPTQDQIDAFKKWDKENSTMIEEFNDRFFE